MPVANADGGQETLRADDLFHLPPGHTVAVEEDVAYVEFSPPAAHDAFLAAAKRNAATAGHLSVEPTLGQAVGTARAATRVRPGLVHLKNVTVCLPSRGTTHGSGSWRRPA